MVQVRIQTETGTGKQRDGGSWNEKDRVCTCRGGPPHASGTRAATRSRMGCRVRGVPSGLKCPNCWEGSEITPLPSPPEGSTKVRPSDSELGHPGRKRTQAKGGSLAWGLVWVGGKGIHPERLRGPRWQGRRQGDRGKEEHNEGWGCALDCGP